MIEIFDKCGGALLILGEPGSGKTTSLLQIARDLLDRAEKDATASFPVIFSLSSWAEAKKPLTDWLVDELRKDYTVPPELGKAWVIEEAVIPLLDGLDEVRAEHRNACVQAINTFRSEHGLAPLVVCSRKDAYEELDIRLKLHDQILVRPLTSAQVMDLLAQASGRSRLERLRRAMQERKDLQQLAETPLMLAVMIVVYDGEAGDMVMEGTLEEQRRRIFDQYIGHMLERQRREGRNNEHQQFTRAQTLHWLSWLAKTMTQHDQTVLYLEWMQPDWLPTPMQARIVSLGTCLVAGIIAALSMGMLVPVLGDPSDSIPIGLFCAVLVGASAYSRTIKTTELLRLSKPSLRRGLGRLGSPRAIGGAIGGTIGVLIATICTQVLCGSSVDFTSFSPLIAVLFLTLIGLLFGSSLALIYTFTTTDQLSIRRTPNEGILRSARFAPIGVLLGSIVGGLIGGLTAGLLPGRGRWPNFDLHAALYFAPIVALTNGLIIGIGFGGRACIQHTILRLLLWWNRFTPRPTDLVLFLDYATERILLRKAGGGYAFIHSLLKDYFAELEL